MVPVRDGEAAGDVRVDRDVTVEVVARGKVVVVGAGGEEAEGALGPARVPPVARVLVVAAPVGARVVAEVQRMAGAHGHVERIDVRLVQTGVDAEVLPVSAAALLEILLIPPEPTEVVVERPVLHREDDDRVDRAIRCRMAQHAVGWQREPRHVPGTRTARRHRAVAAREEPGTAEHRRPAHEAGGAQELATVHRAHRAGLYSTPGGLSRGGMLSAAGRRGRRGSLGRRSP